MIKASNIILVCINRRAGANPSCGGRGSAELAERLENFIAERELPIEIERIVCLGHCKEGPNVRLLGGKLLHGVGPDADLDNLLTRLGIISQTP